MFPVAFVALQYVQDEVQRCPLFNPNPKGVGPYNLVSVLMYIRTLRTSVDSDFSEVSGSNRYTKIRYGLRIMHVK